jgi:cytoskeletal protein CcmA (bactofilin family)
MAAHYDRGSATTELSDFERPHRPARLRSARLASLQRVELRLKLRDPGKLQIEIAAVLPQFRSDLINNDAQAAICPAFAPQRVLKGLLSHEAEERNLPPAHSRVKASRSIFTQRAPYLCRRAVPKNAPREPAMWNSDKTHHTDKTQQTPVAPTPQTPAVAAPVESRAADTKGRVPTLGSSVLIKGVLTASEDLTVDGRVEGRIHLPDHTLTIGPNAKIDAEIVAKVVTVFGTVRGNVTAHDRLDIRSAATLEGEVTCARISIQDGATFGGSVTMGATAVKRPKANGADPDATHLITPVAIAAAAAPQ